MVDSNLTADAAINLREKRGWEMNEWKASEVCGRDEPREIAYHTTTQSEKRRTPFRSDVVQPTVDERCRVQRLLLLTWRDDHKRGLEAPPKQAVFNSATEQRVDILVADDHHLTSKSEAVQFLTDEAEHTRTDAYAVEAPRAPYVRGTHLSPSSPGCESSGTQQ